MTERYVHIGLGTGGDAGTSWADAYRTVAGLQTGLDATVAGDTLHLASVGDAPVDLTACLDIDTNVGAIGNPCQVIGYADGSDPVNDGTNVVLDGADNAVGHAILCGENSWHYHNLHVTNTTSYGWNVADSTDHNVFCNCNASLAGSYGWYAAAGANYNSFIACNAFNNASHGWYRPSASSFDGCSGINNGNSGAYLYIGTAVTNCLFAGNGRYGIEIEHYGCDVWGSTLDANKLGGIYSQSTNRVLHSRLTNNQVAAFVGDGTSDVTDLWNFIAGNAAVSSNVTLLSEFKGEDTQLTTGRTGYADVSYEFDFDNGSGTPFIVGETITGDGSGTTAVITAVTDGGATGTIRFKNQTGIMFNDGEQVTGGTGGKTADLDGVVSLYGTPDYRMILGAAGYRQAIPMRFAGNGIVVNRGMPNVPLVWPRGSKA